MQVAELEASLRANIGSFMANLRMAQAQTNDTRRDIERLELAAEGAGQGLENIGVSQTKMAETLAALDRVAANLRSLKDQAIVSKDALRELGFSNAQIADVHFKAGVVERDLKDIRDAAIEADLAMRLLGGRQANPLGGPGSYMTRGPGGRYSGSEQLPIIGSYERFGPQGVLTGQGSGFGPLGSQTRFPDWRTGLSGGESDRTRSGLFGMLFGARAAQTEGEKTGSAIERAIARESGGAGGGFDRGALGGFFQGLLPGGRRAGAGVVTTGIGLLVAGAPALGAGAAGLGAGAAGGFEALAGSAGVLKLAFADLTSQAFTQQKAYDKLTEAQKHFVDQLRSVDAGLMKGLEAHAQATVLPGLTAGIHEALTPAFVSQLTSAVDAFGKSIAVAAEAWGKLIGSSQFASAFGDVMRADAQYAQDFFVGLSKVFDAFIHLQQSAIPLTNWLSSLGVKLADWIDKSVKAAQQSGELAKFWDEARVALTALGGLVASVAGALHSLVSALGGFNISIAVITTLTRAFDILGHFLNANRDTLRAFFAGALGSINDVISAVKYLLDNILTPLITVAGKFAQLVGGWRVVIDGFIVWFIIRWAAGFTAPILASFVRIATAGADMFLALRIEAIAAAEAIDSALISTGIGAILVAFGIVTARWLTVRGSFQRDTSAMGQMFKNLGQDVIATAVKAGQIVTEYLVAGPLVAFLKLGSLLPGKLGGAFQSGLDAIQNVFTGWGPTFIGIGANIGSNTGSALGTNLYNAAIPGLTATAGAIANLNSAMSFLGGGGKGPGAGQYAGPLPKDRKGLPFQASFRNGRWQTTMTRTAIGDTLTPAQAAIAESQWKAAHPGGQVPHEGQTETLTVPVPAVNFPTYGTPPPLTQTKTGGGPSILSQVLPPDFQNRLADAQSRVDTAKQALQDATTGKETLKAANTLRAAEIHQLDVIHAAQAKITHEIAAQTLNTKQLIEAHKELQILTREAAAAHHQIHQAVKAQRDARANIHFEHILGIDPSQSPSAASLLARERRMLTHLAAPHMITRHGVRQVDPNHPGLDISRFQHESIQQIIKDMQRQGFHFPESALNSLQKINEVLNAIRHGVKPQQDVLTNIRDRLGQINDTLKNQKTTFASNYVPIGDITGGEGLTREQRIAIRDRQAQFQAHHGMRPSGYSAQGVPLDSHGNPITSAHHAGAGAPPDYARAAHVRPMHIPPAGYATPAHHHGGVGNMTVNIVIKDTRDPRLMARTIREELIRLGRRGTTQLRGPAVGSNVGLG